MSGGWPECGVVVPTGRAAGFAMRLRDLVRGMRGMGCGAAAFGFAGLAAERAAVQSMWTDLRESGPAANDDGKGREI